MRAASAPVAPRHCQGPRPSTRPARCSTARSDASPAAGVFHAVSSHVVELAAARVHPVFLLDEAHLLHQDTLDHLHILLNYEWDSKAFLSLVLVGLSELDDRLALRRNRSLASRLHHRFLIGPLTPEDTAAYVRARLARAGCTRELFPQDSLAMLHEATRGAMRDRVASAALRQAARLKRRSVERDVLARVLDAQERES
jgi:general secretion pathway protein A